MLNRHLATDQTNDTGFDIPSAGSVRTWILHALSPVSQTAKPLRIRASSANDYLHPTST